MSSGDALFIAVFHSVLGATPGFRDFCDEIQEQCTVDVVAPDLFDGRQFDDIDNGVAYAAEFGFGEVIARGVGAVESWQGRCIAVGVSLGVLPAQFLAQTDVRVRALVGIGSCIPFREFGEHWPPRVTAEFHVGTNDEFFFGDGDAEAAEELIADGHASLITYDNVSHLFTEGGHVHADPFARASVVAAIGTLVHRLS